MTIKDKSLGLTYDIVTENYYLFDSHATDEMGNTDPDGVARMFTFRSADSFVEYIKNKFCSEAIQQFDFALCRASSIYDCEAKRQFRVHDGEFPAFCDSLDELLEGKGLLKTR